MRRANKHPQASNQTLKPKALNILNTSLTNKNTANLKNKARTPRLAPPPRAHSPRKLLEILRLRLTACMKDHWGCCEHVSKDKGSMSPQWWRTHEAFHYLAFVIGSELIRSRLCGNLISTSISGLCLDININKYHCILGLVYYTGALYLLKMRTSHIPPGRLSRLRDSGFT